MGSNWENNWGIRNNFLLFNYKYLIFFNAIKSKKPVIKPTAKPLTLYGATYPIRTDDPRITSAMLWPAELKWQLFNW